MFNALVFASKSLFILRFVAFFGALGSKRLGTESPRFMAMRSLMRIIMHLTNKSTSRAKNARRTLLTPGRLLERYVYLRLPLSRDV